MPGLQQSMMIENRSLQPPYQPVRALFLLINRSGRYSSWSTGQGAIPPYQPVRALFLLINRSGRYSSLSTGQGAIPPYQPVRALFHSWDDWRMPTTRTVQYGYIL
jgi:hypothetical protein